MSALSGLASAATAYQPIQSTVGAGTGAGANLFQGANQLVTNPSGGISALANNYAGAYGDILNRNLGLYRDVLANWNQTGTSQQQAQQGILAAYPKLSSDVLAMLGIGAGGAVGAGGAIDTSKIDLTKGAAGIPAGSFGVATPAAQAIANTLVSNQGANVQNLVNAGLGGTTVLPNLQNQAAFQAYEAAGSLGAQLAQTGAGYASSIGEAGLNYANQAVMQNTALRGQELKFMEGTSIPYPNAAAYGSLIGAGLQAQLGNRRAGQGGGAVVNPYGSADQGTSQLGHTPFLSGTMPSPPGGGMQTAAPPRPAAAPQTIDVQAEISRGLSTGANTVAASYGMSQGDYNNWVATGSPTDENGNPVDSYGNPLVDTGNTATNQGGDFGATDLSLAYGGGGEF